MDDNRTMAQLLEAPTEGYEDAIVVPEITADNFELKHGLLTLVQNKQFFGHDKEDPHAHIRYFNKITSTMKFLNVPSTSVKLMLFPFSLEGAARIWLEKEPPRSILTWDDLVSKFINKFFPPSKTTNLRNEITRFQQRFDETFYEAWDRFNDLLWACPHHGFSELHQLDTFYNALNSNDQDSLNSTAGWWICRSEPALIARVVPSQESSYGLIINAFYHTVARGSLISIMKKGWLGGDHSAMASLRILSRNSCFPIRNPYEAKWCVLDPRDINEDAPSPISPQVVAWLVRRAPEEELLSFCQKRIPEDVRIPDLCRIRVKPNAVTVRDTTWSVARIKCPKEEDSGL
ncbi:reverse transcriptase domain-containing protein [Tanacetum coccineum]